MCVNATEIGTRNYCTVDARPSRMGKVQSSGSFEYIEFYGDMAAHTLWYISYNMYITHTHTHNNRKLFVLADDDIFLFSFSFTTISFSPTHHPKKKKTELRKGVLILLFLFYVMILFTHKHFGWQHQNDCFFLVWFFFFFKRVRWFKKENDQWKRNEKQWNVSRKNVFFLIEWRRIILINYVRAIKKREREKGWYIVYNFII